LNTKLQVVAIAVLMVVIIVVVPIMTCSPTVGPIDTSLLNCKVSSLSEEGMSVSQGGVMQVNVTLTSRADQDLIIPIGNPVLDSFYNSSDGAKFYSSVIEAKVLNCTFDHDQLVLPSYGSTSTVLTLKMAEDAPVDEYEFDFEFGNAQVTQFPGYALMITVTPKLN
jgi:hypothetical protein